MTDNIIKDTEQVRRKLKIMAAKHEQAAIYWSWGSARGTLHDRGDNLFSALLETTGMLTFWSAEVNQIEIPDPAFAQLPIIRLNH